jgi:hypothetical protein
MASLSLRHRVETIRTNMETDNLPSLSEPKTDQSRAADNEQFSIGRRVVHVLVYSTKRGW